MTSSVDLLFPESPLLASFTDNDPSHYNALPIIPNNFRFTGPTWTERHGCEPTGLDSFDVERAVRCHQKEGTPIKCHVFGPNDCPEHNCGRRNPETGHILHVLRCGHEVQRADQAHCSEDCMNPIWMVNGVIGKARRWGCEYCGPWRVEHEILIKSAQIDFYVYFIQQRMREISNFSLTARNRCFDTVDDLIGEFREIAAAALESPETHPGPEFEEAFLDGDTEALIGLCKARLEAPRSEDADYYYDYESESDSDEDIYENPHGVVDDYASDNDEEQLPRFFLNGAMAWFGEHILDAGGPCSTIAQSYREELDGNPRFRAGLIRLHYATMSRQERVDLFVNLFNPVAQRAMDCENPYYDFREEPFDSPSEPSSPSDGTFVERYATPDSPPPSSDGSISPTYGMSHRPPSSDGSINPTYGMSHLPVPADDPPTPLSATSSRASSADGSSPTSRARSNAFSIAVQREVQSDQAEYERVVEDGLVQMLSTLPEPRPAEGNGDGFTIE